MSGGTVHVGDVGTRYRATIHEDGAPLNLSAAVSASLIFHTPAGVLTRPATINETDGEWSLNYTVVAGIDDAFHATPGVYRWQGLVTFLDGSFHTTTGSYRVEPNLT